MKVSCEHHDSAALTKVTITGLVGPRAGLDGFWEEHSRPTGVPAPDCPAPSLVATPNMLFRIPMLLRMSGLNEGKNTLEGEKEMGVPLIGNHS